MPRPVIDSVAANTGGVPVNAVETVVITSSPVSTSGPAAKVRIIASGMLTAGAGTTSMTVAIRRGTTIAGTQVGATISQAIAATANGFWVIEVIDSPGEVAGQQYVATLLQTGGSGNGATFGCLIQTIAD